jgi:hypothetical protein
VYQSDEVEVLVEEMTPTIGPENLEAKKRVGNIPGFNLLDYRCVKL